MFCVTHLNLTRLKIYLPGWLIILFKSNSAWNRVCWSFHRCETCPQIPFVFDKFRLYVCSRQHYPVKNRGNLERVAADNYKGKHIQWPFRPKVFLISQMWSTLPGGLFSLSVCGESPRSFWMSLTADDEVLNRFLLHTLSLRCRDDSEAPLGSGTELRADRWTMKLPSLPPESQEYPWEKHSGLSNLRT